MEGLSNKLLPILKTIATEVASLSFIGLIVMVSIGGVLVMMGNEFGGKKICKNAVYGYIIIQLASMLI